MDMTSLLMRRSAWIFLACFGVALALATLRAQGDIRRESQGADQLAQLVGELSTLQNIAPESLAGQVGKLRDISKSGKLRHLDFQLEDGAGQILIPAAPTASDAMAGRTQLLLQRSDGSRFQATLIPNPASEQEEAVSGILGMAGLFLAYGLAMLAGLYGAVRYAFGPLRGIVAAIASFRKQDFSARLPRLPVRELDHIAGALNHLAEALAAAEARQKHLSLQMLTLQEDERASLAIELHEHLGQGLTALRANIAYLLRQTGEAPRLNAAVRDMEAQTAAIHQEIRSLLRHLQPDAGKESGHTTVDLQPLLHELVKSWQDASGQNTVFHLTVTPHTLCLPRETSLIVYRMTQEALANIARHANAGQVDISVCIDAEQPAMLCWQVSDDGVGMASPEAAMSHGNGLAGIRERVWARGGSLDINPRTAGAGRPGLSLSVRLPVGEPS